MSLLLLFSLQGLAQHTIVSEEIVTEDIRQFEKVVFDLVIEAEYENPYLQEEIKVDMKFTTPSDVEDILPVFYVSENGDISNWKAHFAPRESGTYNYYFELSIDGEIVDTTPAGTFDVEETDTDGFITKHENPDNEWSLTFDSGKPFRGIGINFAWEFREWEDPNHTYEYFFEKFENYGANFVRTWMHIWNLPLEWKQVHWTTNYTNSDEHFNPSAIQRMDEMIELAEEHGIYLMIAFDPHGAFIDNPDQGHLVWDKNNYNSANGGPIDTPAEFFTNADAKAQYKNRLRYLVGRWGYSTSIAVWEFFNEVDNIKNAENVSDFHIVQWHTEMSAYLKSIDPYNHIVSTSISHDPVQGLFSVGNLDVNQRHLYRVTGTIPEVLNNHGTGKPFVIGEFGREWDWNLDFSTMEDEKIHDFKRGLWYGLFNPTPILPMSWWWEWFDERDMMEYFEGVRIISDLMIKDSKSGIFEHVQNSFSEQSFALKTDSAIFAYIHNTGTSSISDQTLNVSTDNFEYEIRIFDPETLEFEELGKFTPNDGQIGIPHIDLDGWEQKIITMQPLGKPTNADIPGESFQLKSNYPNPFNAMTNIPFTIAEPTGLRVRLEVFNALGERLTVLKDGEYFSQGSHVVSFDAELLASGLYVYKLTARDVTRTRKMMLLK